MKDYHNSDLKESVITNLGQAYLLGERYGQAEVQYSTVLDMMQARREKLIAEIQEK